MFIKVLGVSYQYWKKYDDSRVLHYPNATDRVSVDPWKLPDTLLTKISHFYISFIYCIESVFIRVWGMVKLIVASIWWFKGICLKPQKWVRQIPWCRLIVTYCMIKVSHLISFSLLWNCFYKGWDAPDNLLRHPFQEVFIWPQCLLQQNDISLTPNPQIDILETPGGHLIAYYEKIWYIKSLYPLYIASK